MKIERVLFPPDFHFDLLLERVWLSNPLPSSALGEGNGLASHAAVDGDCLTGDVACGVGT